MTLFSKTSLRKRTRWVAAVLLVCMGFFHASAAFSVCLPGVGGQQQAEVLTSEQASMRAADLLCKTHCDSTNSQASYASVTPVAHLAASISYLLPVPVQVKFVDSRQSVPDLIDSAPPDPVYLLSARLRV